MGRAKRLGKLWGKVEEILECKPTRVGDSIKYQIKLVGVAQLLWVHEKDLSKGVHKTYQADGSLVKGARVYVDRVHVTKQRTYLSQSAETAVLDPLKVVKRVSGWVKAAQLYVVEMNKVLRSPVNKRSSAFEKMISILAPPKTVLEIMKLSDYLDGTYQIWARKDDVFMRTEKKLGHLTCTCCDTTHHFGRLDRTLMHIMSKNHHAKVKKQAQAVSQARSQNILNEHCKSSASKSYLLAHVYCFYFLYLQLM